MRNQIQPIVLMIGISSLILGLSLEAFCQPDEKWRERSDKGNRYEGRVDIKVRQPLIELISFSSFQEEYTQGGILKVRFYLHDTFHVYLTARELERREHYWMEAKPQEWRIGWNEFGPWPVAEVLGRYNVPADNLGVLVRLFVGEPNLEGESGYISPVVLYQSSFPSEIKHYSAYFIPGRSLAGGRYKVYKEHEGNELLNEGPVGRQGAAVPFPIRFHLPNDWQGLVRFKIVVNPKNEVALIPPSYEYLFYHIPVLNNQEPR